MIAAALSAELYKLTRNRTVLIWAFCVTPLATLGFGILSELMMANSEVQIGALMRAQPVEYAFGGLGAAANVLVQLLLILGASIIFAGEYRWETWRAVLPRSSRTALIAAKFATYTIAAALSLIACAVAGLFVGLMSGVIHGQALAWPSDSGTAALGMLNMFATCVLQITVVGGLCLLIAVGTRSVLATALVTFLILLGQEIAAARISMMQVAEAWHMLLPTIAARYERSWAASTIGNSQPLPYDQGPTGIAVLAAWTIVLVLAALIIFRRQDLSRE